MTVRALPLYTPCECGAVAHRMRWIVSYRMRRSSGAVVTHWRKWERECIAIYRPNVKKRADNTLAEPLTATRWLATRPATRIKRIPNHLPNNEELES